MSTTTFLNAFTEKRKLMRHERDELLYVDCYLNNTAPADTLEAMYKRRKSAYTKEWAALWTGMYELRKCAERDFNSAKERGQLLFCFEGTTVLQGGAA